MLMCTFAWHTFSEYIFITGKVAFLTGNNPALGMFIVNSGPTVFLAEKHTHTHTPEIALSTFFYE